MTGRHPGSPIARPRPTWDLIASAQVLSLVSRKWALPVFHALESGSQRHHELQVLLGVRGKVLTETLRSLERDGLVARELGIGWPAPTLYRLTELGQSLSAILVAASAWSVDNLDKVERHRRRVDEDEAAA